VSHAGLALLRQPLLRVTAHVRTATFRWISAAIGGYCDGDNALADSSKAASGPEC